MTNKTVSTISLGRILENIVLFRKRKVMLDSDLASLYGVSTHVLNQAVKRNLDRFPEDFMFQLTLEEYKNLISQFVISSRSCHGGRRSLPYVFTEQGVAMLSGVLNSQRAVQVNIEIMRAFVKLREMIISHEQLQHKIEQMEKKYDKSFSIVFETLRKLLSPPEKPRREIGFHVKV